MSDQLLTVLKFALLALLYLFFLRVVRAVWAELKDPAAQAPVPVPMPLPAPAMAAAPTIVRPAQVTAAVPGPGAPPPVADPQLHLVVVDPAEARGRTFPLGEHGQTDLTVGRAIGCGLALPEDTFVSQLHARLFQADGTWQIEDLGSTNGTFLNRHKVSGPQALRPGDRIQIGRTELEVAR